MNERGTRRFSEAISEGDGISVLVEVSDAEGARAAARQGAEGLVVRGALAGVRDATELPILWCAEGTVHDATSAGADAWLLTGDDWQRIASDIDTARGAGLDCVVQVRDEDEIEDALEHVDPEIFLLAGASGDPDAELLDHVLSLLPDVPAGKLAIAEVAVTTRDEVVALERAGVDAVIVGARDVAELVGDSPVDV